MHKSLSLIILIVCAALWSCNTKSGKAVHPLEVVTEVAIERYTGTWHEIARYPNRFQKDCAATTATYILQQDGTLKVINRCRKGSPDGPEKSVTGKAWIVDAAVPAKLKVSFVPVIGRWLFAGDYWIIQLDPDYHYAVVGHPERKYLWILSRTAVMDDETFNMIVRRLEQQGYDPGRLIKSALQEPSRNEGITDG